ncbi:MAG: SGNH/GDSL hydrolase family protein [Deltaproteobacteria bacterium]|nr:MAG: SGNH/GDSL hydrolase family protein [Deltaproteobacteria bacterium]
MEKSFLYKLLVLAGIIVVLLVLAEIGVRVVFAWKMQKAANLNLPAGQMPPQYATPGLSYSSQDNFSKMIFDPVVCYRPKPGHKGKGYAINGQGFRYRKELIEPKPPRTIRIFILGGSFAFGAGVPDGYTYFEVMEADLQKRFPENKIEVVCAAVGAYSSLQEYLLLATRLVRFQPDLVMALTLANDAYFTTKGQDVLKGNDYLGYDAAIRACIDKRILGRYYYGQIFRDPDASFPPLWSDYWVKLHWAWDTALFRWRGEIPDKVKHQPSLPAEAAERFVYVQKLLRACAALENIETLIFLQPTISTTGKALHPVEKKLQENFRFQERVFRDIYGQVQDLSRRESLGFIDINADMAGLGEDFCFFVDWVHAGEIGQKWLGGYLAEKAAPVIERRKMK